MSRILLISSLLASTSFAVNITFASEGQCTGRGLYGVTGVDMAVPCYNLSTYYDPAQSLIVADVAGYSVAVYSDDACSTSIAEATDDSCVDFAGKTAQSFMIRQVNSTTHTDMAIETESSTTDLVPYGVKLSDYKGLSQTSPYNIDLAFSEGYINTALIYTGTTLTIGSGVAGCILLGGATPLAIAACVGTAVGTILTYIGKYRVHTHNKKTHGTYQLSTGHLDRRQLIDDANYDYLNAIHGNDSETFQDGWMERDMGNGVQRSPVYRFNSTEPDLNQFLLSAFYNEDTDSMQHVIEWTDEPLSSALQKRYINYDGIRKSGYGLAYEFCPFHTGSSSSSWGESVSTIYKRVRDQDACLYSTSQYQGARAMLVDFESRSSVTVGSANIAAYKYGTSPNFQGLTLCTGRSASTNEDCIEN